ncbi:hypothetical protein PHYSODRAFT_553932 [Phytophthora sojae]|uniref:RING-type domain-containing protein n=1 Tax=Phytophthora sojae (strain P6497) TaxID=1094619 RepID=G4YEY7_PHYSP|nr:hypothetical protein PHYSODRAFT_553932 [Phytophthora sojae]EGZ27351.1 hypothetical protein PHYSODRAFT_553932 [Phytophthora sojae]|eukprot:XP_009514626.1 hypothetical protein PHYSODRAFT_553932 [Phytophthora sojae]
MTLPSRFLASRFGAADAAGDASSRRSRSGAALDNLLNDSDDDWAPTRDHFVLPHMVHFQDVYERDGGADSGADSGAGPTQQPVSIDLTVSSSEDEGDDAQSRPSASGADAADSDDIIEIVEVSGGSGPPPPAPLRRKRRRPAPGNAVTKRQHLTDITHSAESTSVSMHNNEQLEKFKAALKCSICLDVIEDITSTTCGHIFCGGCIHQAIRASGKCPLCQRRLYPKDTHRLFF